MPGSEGEDETKLLARVDERTKAIQGELHELWKRFDSYVTRHEFTPVKMIAFGLAALILTSVIAAVLASVIVKGH